MSGEELKVGVGEFTRAIAALSQQIEGVAATSSAALRVSQDTLHEARKTNGRVTAVEAKLTAFEASGFISRRDLALVGGTLAATVAVIKLLPAMLAAAKHLVAP